MSCNPRSTKVPLALAVALAVGSGSAAWAQTNPSFHLLIANHEPIELGPLIGEVDAGQNPVYLRFEPATGLLKLRALDALLCFDYSEAAPAPRLRAGLMLPIGVDDTLNGISAAAISPGQADDGWLVYLAPTYQLDCRAFPDAQLEQLELEKEATLAGATSLLFKSSFDRQEAQPSLELEIIDGRGRASVPKLNDTIAYTIRVVPRDRRQSGPGIGDAIFVEDVRIRDYAPPVNTNGRPLALSQLATITRCSVNGNLTDAFGQPFQCVMDQSGLIRIQNFGAALRMPADSFVEFDIERTVIGSPGTPPGPVTLIAVASASPELDNLGSLEGAYHVFTFS